MALGPSRWVAVVIAVFGCRSPAATGGAAASSSASAALAASAPAAASARPLAAEPGRGPDGVGAPGATEPPRVPGAGCPDSVAAEGRARKAAREQRWDDAITAFDQAIRGRPVHARLRAERGFAYLKLKSAERARQDFYDALALTKDERLMAEVWYNVGLADTALGDAEGARIAFVLAERHGSKAATAKLGAASRCAATWRVAPAGEVPIARGWSALAAARGRPMCNLPALEPAAKPSARELACHGCGYGDSDEGDQCTGDPPWMIASGYLHGQSFSFYVVPLAADTFFYSQRGLGGAPDYRVEGDLLVVTYGDWRRIPEDAAGSDLLQGRFRGQDYFVRAGGGWEDEMDVDGTWLLDGGTGCQPDLDAEVTLPQAVAMQIGGTPMIPLHPGPMVSTWYSIAKRRALFELSAYGEEITATLRDGVAEVRGGACSADVPLAPAPVE